jgi:hypothetical protein
MGGSLSALLQRSGGRAGVTVGGLLLVLAFLRAARRRTHLQLRHMQSLIEDMQAGRVAHLQFGPDVIFVLLKAAEAAASAVAAADGAAGKHGSADVASAASAAAAAAVAATGGGGGGDAGSYGVRVLPFLFNAVADRVAALMLEHRVPWSEKQQSAAGRLSFLLLLLPLGYLVAMYAVSVVRACVPVCVRGFASVQRHLTRGCHLHHACARDRSQSANGCA